MVVSTEVNLPDPNGQRGNPRQFYARRTVAPGGYDSAGERESDEEAEEDEEEEEEDDEDDEDEEDEEGNRYYDSEDDTLFQGGLPPLAKRTKITKPQAEAGETTRGADEFWVAFDDLVVPKTMIGRLICPFWFNKRDFDELKHFQTSVSSSRAASMGLSPFSTLKCCLIMPCSAGKEEMLRVGKHLHSLLKLQGSLYYRVVNEPRGGREVGDSPRNAVFDLLSDDGKMTEELFRRYAQYRIKKEEVHGFQSNTLQ
ncbi:hypothetical protein BBJ28_00017866 [Nothophytophthora sp. Chile5]|nr:hypothetical protein BBJ28_00017866 [Nothophytophthora sp. Chile5]